ncbi:MarR family winged helix-turn-helix transcriptional regulator [Aegicerativicinus sediminis]
MSLKLPSETIFYKIEEAIKTYRKFAINNITKEFPDLTLDQGLILIYLNGHSGLTLSDLADLLFKDNAAVSRMIESMMKKGYLAKSINEFDKRKSVLSLTPKSQNELVNLTGIIEQNRIKAIHEITQFEMDHLNDILEKLIKNCKSN